MTTPKRLKNYLFLFGLFFLSFNLFAQEPMKLGKVSKADLEMTVYEQDTSAEALILFDQGNIEFNFNEGVGYIFTKHKRIKILKKSGYDYGDVSFSYYTEGTKSEKLRNIKAIVHNPDGSSVKLSKNDFFNEEIDDRWTRVRFSFPNLQVGSVIEYRYEKYSPYIETLEEWFFQHDIPTRWSEYHLKIPNWYQYVGISQGRALDIAEHEEVEIRYQASVDNGVQASSRGSLTLLTSDSRLVMKDVPALKEESYITTMDDYRARIRYQLKATTYDNIFKPHLTNWQDVSGKLVERSYFGGQYSKKRNFKAIKAVLDAELAKASTQKEKAQIIYDHINNTIEWDETLGYGASEDLADLYEQKRASAAEMNMMILGMLKDQEIKAYPLLVSTRTHGKMLELYPILSQFNHMMLIANLDGQDIIMDAGNPCRPIGMPRPNALNGYKAMLVDPELAQWITLPVQPSKSVSMARVKMDEDGMITGSISEMMNGYDAVYMRNALEDSDAKELYNEDYTATIPEIEISSIEINEEEKDMSKAYKANLEFNIPNQAMVNGDFIYFSPMLDPWFDENPFKLEKRDYPVDFPMPINERYVLVMELPEGYVIEEKPEDVNYSLPGRTATFSYSVKQMGTQLTMNCNLGINKLQFQPEEYGNLKRFFDLVLEKQTEQLVLKYNE